MDKIICTLCGKEAYCGRIATGMFAGCTICICKNPKCLITKHRIVFLSSEGTLVVENITEEDFIKLSSKE